MLLSILEKLQERSPLKYTIMQNSSSISPIMMACDSDKLYASSSISENVAENAKV